MIGVWGAFFFFFFSVLFLFVSAKYEWIKQFRVLNAAKDCHFSVMGLEF